jgi:hypothetical protein
MSGVAVCKKVRIDGVRLGVSRYPGSRLPPEDINTKIPFFLQEGKNDEEGRKKNEELHAGEEDLEKREKPRSAGCVGACKPLGSNHLGGFHQAK